MANYDEASVLNTLRKNVGIDYANHTLRVNPDNPNIGNGTWGKIDYLCNYCGWRWIKSKDMSIHVGGNNKPTTHKRDSKKNEDHMKKSKKK